MYLTSELKRKLLQFLGLILVSIVVTYYLPAPVVSLFFLALLVVYFRSDAEPFWLAYFLVISDGFFGFFEGPVALVGILPGLPAIEAPQLYIMIALYKAIRKKTDFQVFFHVILKVMLVYLLFLVVQGYVLGISLSLNIQFRLVKIILPLALFYIVPRLFDREEHYMTFLKYLFPVAAVAFLAQLFSIVMGESPTKFFGVAGEDEGIFHIDEQSVYRGFYNAKIVLFTYFGALFALAVKSKHFKPALLYGVVAVDFLSVFLSATRGWMIGITLTLLLFILYVARIQIAQTARVMIILVILGGILYSFPIVRLQVNNSVERMMTLEALAEGDVTAGGTLKRLDERSPKVIGKWKRSVLTGWGFSDEFFDYKDPHVGNQTILMHSGILGAILMALFFFYFNATLFLKSISLPYDNIYKKALLVFVIFFLGWFIIHSTSSQYFSYYQSPGGAMVQAFFFSLGALAYREATKSALPA